GEFLLEVIQVRDRGPARRAPDLPELEDVDGPLLEPGDGQPANELPNVEPGRRGADGQGGAAQGGAPVLLGPGAAGRDGQNDREDEPRGGARDHGVLLRWAGPGTGRCRWRTSYALWSGFLRGMSTPTHNRLGRPGKIGPGPGRRLG